MIGFLWVYNILLYLRSLTSIVNFYCRIQTFNALIGLQNKVHFAYVTSALVTQQTTNYWLTEIVWSIRPFALRLGMNVEGKLTHVLWFQSVNHCILNSCQNIERLTQVSFMSLRLKLSNDVRIESVEIGEKYILQKNLHVEYHIHIVIDIEHRVMLIMVAHCLINDWGRIVVRMVSQHIIYFEEVINCAI